jgi:hypothetical protein
MQAVLPPKFLVNIGYKRVCFGVQQADVPPRFWVRVPSGRTGVGPERLIRPSALSLSARSHEFYCATGGAGNRKKRSALRSADATSMGLSPNGPPRCPPSCQFRFWSHGSAPSGRFRACCFSSSCLRGRRFRQRFWCARSRRGAPVKFRCAATMSATSATSRTLRRPSRSVLNSGAKRKRVVSHQRGTSAAARTDQRAGHAPSSERTLADKVVVRGARLAVGG